MSPPFVYVRERERERERKRERERERERGIVWNEIINTNCKDNIIQPFSPLSTGMLTWVEGWRW